MTTTLEAIRDLVGGDPYNPRAPFSEGVKREVSLIAHHADRYTVEIRTGKNRVRFNFVGREPVIMASSNGETIAVYGEREVTRNIWNSRKNINEDGLHIWWGGGYQLTEARRFQHAFFSNFEISETGDQITFLGTKIPVPWGLHHIDETEDLLIWGRTTEKVVLMRSGPSEVTKISSK